MSARDRVGLMKKLNKLMKKSTVNDFQKWELCFNFLDIPALMLGNSTTDYYSSHHQVTDSVHFWPEGSQPLGFSSKIEVIPETLRWR